LHALRRTFASLLAVVPGNDTPYIISQVRHTDPGVTYCYYAKAVRPEHRRALIALVKGDYLALTGTGALNGTRAGAESVAWEKAETAD
jgi:hypothetical protein